MSVDNVPTPSDGSKGDMAVQNLFSGRLARGAMAVVALAALMFVALPASRAEAAVPHLTATTVSCPTFTTYGTPATCTLRVADVTPFVTKKAPTGTVAIGTILDRLDVSGSPCTLVAVSGSASECSVTVTPTDIGPIVPGASYTPTGNFVLSVGVGATLARPADLTITADAQSRDYGSANPTLTATYDGFVLGEGPSDLVGSLECSTTADTASVPGEYPITCGGQDSLYYYIDWVDGTLTVDPAPLTITADDHSRDYGSANPTLTATYDGFVLDQGPEDLTGTLECTTAATTSSPVGDYPITCGGQTSANYDITYVDGDLTVGSVPLTITADHATRLAGTANPTFTVTYDGFVLADGPEDLTGTLECTTTATPDSGPGAYPISCTGLTSADYDITWVDGTLDVVAAPTGVVSGGGEVRPGGTVTVDTEGWMPGTTITATACDVPVGELTADTDGRAQGTFTLPGDLPVGECTLVLSGTDDAGGPYAVVLGLTVTRPAEPVVPSGVLPYTGGPIAGTALFGLGVLIAGAGLHLVHRRRRHLTPAVVRTDDGRRAR